MWTTVCVCVFGFYNFHLPKHSKFFQSVYYIYYLSHAQPVSLSLFPFSLCPSLPLCRNSAYIAHCSSARLCLSAAVLAPSPFFPPLPPLPLLQLHSPLSPSLPLPATITAAQQQRACFICIFWLLCGKNITCCAAASKQTAPPPPPLPPLTPYYFASSRVTLPKTGQR